MVILVFNSMDINKFVNILDDNAPLNQLMAPRDSEDEGK
jgi:hypothetical protein